jgi:benzoyl-CoA reductase/2-hydroxyglutaryl-CoA dehydratase subunit BcrC/BadD/HgdB
MEAACKVIRLKPHNTSPVDLMKEENVQKEQITYTELQSFVAKARNVIDTMEEEWQDNHNSPVIVEHLHLLRNYIEFLRRYHEGNT